MTKSEALALQPGDLVRIDNLWEISTVVQVVIAANGRAYVHSTARDYRGKPGALITYRTACQHVHALSESEQREVAAWAPVRAAAQTGSLTAALDAYLSVNTQN